MPRHTQCILMVLTLIAPAALGSSAAADARTMVVFDRVSLEWSGESPQVMPRDPYIIRRHGQEAERTLMLPAKPVNQRDAKRITARVSVQPVLVDEGDRVRIADPWSRLGHVVIVVPGEQPDETREIEIMRFIIGFGGASTFEQDVTAYAPLLSGRTTVRLRVSTWMQPAWEASLSLDFHDDGPGYRRPAAVVPVLNEATFTSRNPTRSTSVVMPEGLGLPRLHIRTSGHMDVQEFISATHVLRVNGVEIARWRPWREDGGQFRDANPASERWMIDGRELWSADLDRAGWMPGDLVAPLIIPAPELLGGQTHTIELEILDIRPGPQDIDDPIDGPYWLLSIVIVADEPWPTAGVLRDDDDDGDDGDRP